MDGVILVTYASKYGATAEIAEKIAEGLRRTGLQTEVHPVENVRFLESYRAVVMGSAVYVGKWLKGAEKFLKAHEKALAKRPVWLFSSGPTGEGDPVELVEGKGMPDSLQLVVDRIQPRDIAFFHGNINPDKVNFIEKWVVNSLVKKPFGDFRDWDMVVRWTNKIVNALANGSSQ